MCIIEFGEVRAHYNPDEDTWTVSNGVTRNAICPDSEVWETIMDMSAKLDLATRSE